MPKCAILYTIAIDTILIIAILFQYMQNYVYSNSHVLATAPSVDITQSHCVPIMTKVIKVALHAMF